jgi:hypothetical protein
MGLRWPNRGPHRNSEEQELTFGENELRELLSTVVAQPDESVGLDRRTTVGLILELLTCRKDVDERNYRDSLRAVEMVRSRESMSKSPEGLIWRVATLLQNTGILLKSEPLDPDRLAEWKPLGQLIVFDETLTAVELVQCVVHELARACLHPPNSDMEDECRYYDLKLEERSCHVVTNSICRQYGIVEYRTMTARHGIPYKKTEGGDPETIEIVSFRVLEALDAPCRIPRWLDPVNKELRMAANLETKTRLENWDEEAGAPPHPAKLVMDVYQELSGTPLSASNTTTAGE